MQLKIIQLAILSEVPLGMGLPGGGICGSSLYILAHFSADVNRMVQKVFRGKLRRGNSTVIVASAEMICREMQENN